ncbi:D-alanine transaminase [Pararhizobium capsulatum DSM 1112]|uniref:Probable branched-chain-amino-acid aminotransferase n=1 Tax=Pararhizobium capsulatum DSM 1112 TaxID=1121113 RepID=A0ABU0BVZ1_9HYPH|nr:D-amino-acid transaminase [Pararhizobium capsulatum]MDQ0322118.1 D-alanine transaminase [Pararhizobium capsulatum DSM 1112]
MSRTVYVDGEYLPENEAKISVFDRGFLFADGIYEVSAVLNGRLIDNDLHLARLERSVREILIPMPLTVADIAEIQAELIRRNDLLEGVVYLQVTRGTADRDFGFAEDMKPTFVAFTQAKTLRDTASVKNGVAVAIMDDTRWARRDIKTVMLLAQVLAKKSARSAGFHEAWLVEDGCITEGASSTAYIITSDGALVVRPNSHAVLPGCTRQAVLKIASEQGLRIEERLFTVAEAHEAREAFLTSASSLVTPVIKIADRVVGDGTPGPITRRLQTIYLELALAQPSVLP